MSVLISKGQETFFYPTTCQPSNHSCKANKVNGVKEAAEMIFSLSNAVVSVPQCHNLINHLPGIQTRHPPAPTPGVLLCLRPPCLSFGEGTRRLLRTKSDNRKAGAQPHFLKVIFKMEKRGFFLHPEETECLMFSEELG